MHPSIPAECTRLHDFGSSCISASGGSPLGALDLNFPTCKMDCHALPHSHTGTLNYLFSLPLFSAPPFLFPLLLSALVMVAAEKEAVVRTFLCSHQTLLPPKYSKSGPFSLRTQRQTRVHFTFLLKCFRCVSNIFTTGI